MPMFAFFAAETKSSTVEKLISPLSFTQEAAFIALPATISSKLATANAPILPPLTKSVAVSAPPSLKFGEMFGAVL